MLVDQFQKWISVQIPGDKNAEVNALANLGSAVEIDYSGSNSVVYPFHFAIYQRRNEVNIANIIWD